MEKIYKIKVESFVVSIDDNCAGPCYSNQNAIYYSLDDAIDAMRRLALEYAYSISYARCFADNTHRFKTITTMLGEEMCTLAYDRCTVTFRIEEIESESA